jgi:hypothetical protein
VASPKRRRERPGEVRELEQRAVPQRGQDRLSPAAKLMGINRPTLQGLLAAHDMAPSLAPAGAKEEG